MKITPRPVTSADEIDKSRDVTGFNKWARSSRTIGFIMFILGWFVIPVEVLLRRDFGQRWFTIVNYYSGLLLLLIFATVQYGISWIWSSFKDFFLQIATAINPLYKAPDSNLSDQVMERSMLFFLTLYILFGLYHLFKIKWRFRTNQALHSFDDGTSRLEWLGRILMWLFNILATPIMFLCMLLIPRKQRKGKPLPKLIGDRTAFTNTVVEPAAVFFAAWIFPGTPSVWLFLSAIALAIHANWREMAKQAKILDFRDSMIEAKVMMQLKINTEEVSPTVIKKKGTGTAIPSPQVAFQVVQQYPSLTTIIEAYNQQRGS